MKIDNLPEIPDSWLVAILLVGLIIMRGFGIDTWVTASISVILGWLTGVKVEQARQRGENGYKTCGP